MKIELRNKKETDYELAHTDVYNNRQFIGYLLPNKSNYAQIDENWNFVAKVQDFKSFHARTKKELLEKLENQF
jgi:hypothetical protein